MLMKAIVKDNGITNNQVAMKTLFSYLDKGIDDMEAGRMHTAEEAFQIIKARLVDEI